MRKIILAILVSFVGAIAISCNNKPGADLPTVPSIGSYTYNGAEYSLVSAVMDEDEQHLHFLFSHQNIGTEKVSSMFSVSVKRSLLNIVEFKAEDFAHNDDYMFVYETPAVYYSKYKKVTGTIRVEQNSVRNFHIKLDLKLIDGKPFVFDYTGDIHLAQTPK